MCILYYFYALALVEVPSISNRTHLMPSPVRLKSLPWPKIRPNEKRSCVPNLFGFPTPFGEACCSRCSRGLFSLELFRRGIPEYWSGRQRRRPWTSMPIWILGVGTSFANLSIGWKNRRHSHHKWESWARSITYSSLWKKVCRRLMVPSTRIAWPEQRACFPWLGTNLVRLSFWK